MSSLSFPLGLPYPSPASVKLTANNLVAVSASQFTAAQQVQQWLGEWWEMELSLPKKLESDAFSWRAFLAALRGQAGTFIAGPGPDAATGSININRLASPYDFTASQWVQYGTGGITMSPGSAPDPHGSSASGGTNISFPAVGSGISGISQTVQADLRNGTYTFSVYLKAGVPQTISLYLFGDFNMNLPTQSGVGIVCNVTTSWQRFSLSASFPNCVTRSLFVDIHNPGSSGPQVIQAWGAQLERAPSATTPAYDYLSPVVSGSGQAGLPTLTLSGWPSPGLMIPAGGYLQIGSHLYMALTPGQWSSAPQTIDVFPRLRSDVVSGAPIIVNDPVGLFRLAQNPRAWSRAAGYPANVYDFDTIKAREVI